MRGGEDGGIGPELLPGAPLGSGAYHLDGIKGLSLLVLLLINLTVAEHLRRHVRREGIDAAHTHTVKTTAHLVAALVELTTGMKDGHYHLQGALMELLMLVDGNTTAIVLHRDALVGIDGHLNLGAITGHSLVDRVVDSLVDQVMETLFADVSNVHCRALAHCL